MLVQSGIAVKYTTIMEISRASELTSLAPELNERRLAQEKPKSLALMLKTSLLLKSGMKGTMQSPPA